MTPEAASVLATLRRRALCDPSARVAVAVSGGADSVALTLLLAELSAAGHLVLAGLAHLNHGLRGEASDRDQEFCRRLASGCGVPFDVETCEVAALAARPGRSLEEAAREVRYAYLERARVRLGADLVAVGHTRDDQAETVLLRLLAGAGLRGLAAIHPRRGRVIRPLIDHRRADLVAYLDGRGAEWVVDESNLDRARRRNRLRHDVLPAIVSAEGGAVVDVLARTADLAREDDALLAALAAEAAARVTLEAGPPRRLDLEALAGEPLALQRRVLQAAIAEVTGRQPAFVHVDAAVGLAARRRPGSVAVPGGRVELSAGRGVLVHSGRLPEPPAFGAWQYPLAVPGEVLVPEAGGRITARLGGPDLLPRGQAGPLAVALDHAASGDSLVVRAWRPGDRVRLPRGIGRKKVQDLFVDRKLARADRHRVPIVAAGDGRILWVAGHMVAGGALAGSATKSVVVLNFEPLRRPQR